MDKSQSYMSGNVWCPPNEPQNIQQQQDPSNEGRLLWATLTPHGTRHFVTARAVERYPNYDDHYEIIDYHNRPVVRTREGTPRKIPIKVKIYYTYLFVLFVTFTHRHVNGWQQEEKLILWTDPFDNFFII